MIWLKFNPRTIGRTVSFPGGGPFGTIVFFVLFILLLPLLLIIAVFGSLWLLYMRWKLKKQFRKMAEEMAGTMDGDGFVYGPDDPGTKKVESRELPSDFSGR